MLSSCTRICISRAVISLDGWLCVRAHVCVHVCTAGIVLLRLYFDIWFMLVWNHFHASHYAIYKRERVASSERGDLLPHRWHTKWLLCKFHYATDTSAAPATSWRCRRLMKVEVRVAECRCRQASPSGLLCEHISNCDTTGSWMKPSPAAWMKCLKTGKEEIVLCRSLCVNPEEILPWVISGAFQVHLRTFRVPPTTPVLSWLCA